MNNSSPISSKKTISQSFHIMKFSLFLLVISAEIMQFVSSQILEEPKDLIIDANENAEFRCSCNYPDPDDPPDVLFFINGNKIENIGGGGGPGNAGIIPKPRKKGDGTNLFETGWNK